MMAMVGSTPTRFRQSLKFPSVFGFHSRPRIEFTRGSAPRPSIIRKIGQISNTDVYSSEPDVHEACVKEAWVREESGKSVGRRGRKVKSTWLAVLLLSSLAPVMWTQETRPEEANAARVLAMESLWNQAELQKDVKALDQLLSDKFIYVDVDGSLKTKPEFLKGVKNPPEHIGTIASESLAAEVYDSTVVVSGIYREKGTNHGNAYSRRGRFTDTWVKQGKSWLCVASQSTLIQK